MIGTTVGDYRVTGLISDKGGFGIVYKGVHRLLEQEVAIKVLKPKFTSDPEFQERFFTEAKTQARLRHPNIVTLLNFLVHDEQYHLVVEYMDGLPLPNGGRATTLAELLRAGPLPEDRLAGIFRQVLAAVGYAHEQGVIHRDLKPLNVLFTGQGLAKVSDFGIAKILSGESGVSVSGHRVGTPAYMSPEQVLDKRLTRATDIYSLGVMLYEMATGGLPFKESATTSVFEAHLQEPPRPPRQVNPAISVVLERAILRAMEKKPEKRFQSCAEFAAALKGAGERGAPTADRRPLDDQETVPEREAVSGKRKVDGGERAAQGIPHAEPRVPRSPRRAGWVVAIIAVAVVAFGLGMFFALRRGPAVAAAGELRVPELAGATVGAARGRVLIRGLAFDRSDSVLSDDAQKGTVVSSVPPAGTAARRGDTVRVTWCWGRRTCPECHTPRKGAGRFCTRCGYAF